MKIGSRHLRCSDAAKAGLVGCALVRRGRSPANPLKVPLAGIEPAPVQFKMTQGPSGVGSRGLGAN